MHIQYIFNKKNARETSVPEGENIIFCAKIINALRLVLLDVDPVITIPKLKRARKRSTHTQVESVAPW
jgi:hypothetical protein